MTTMTAVSKDDSRSTLERMKQYLDSDSGNPSLLAQVIDLSLAAGEREQARAALGCALRLYPEDAHFQFRLATFCIAERRLDEARQALERVAASQGRPPTVLHNLAYVFVLQGQHREAVALLDEVVAHPEAPDDSTGLLVRCLHHLGELDRAADVARTRLGKDGGDASLLAAASLVLWDLGETDEAGRLAQEALGRAPMALEALVTQGSIALAAQDAPAARERFRRALAVHPADGRSWSGLALADMLASDLDAALTGFRTAVGFMPHHVGTWIAFGWCQLALNQAADAEASFRRALDLDRNFAESHGSLAVVAALSRNTAAAMENAERALRLDAQCISARFAQSILAGEVSDEASVRRLAQRLLSGRRKTR
jgi:Flp pilus assembly protein TadD